MAFPNLTSIPLTKAKMDTSGLGQVKDYANLMESVLNHIIRLMALLKILSPPVIKTSTETFGSGLTREALLFMMGKISNRSTLQDSRKAL